MLRVWGKKKLLWLDRPVGGGEGKGVVALALCLSLVTQSRSGESVGDSRKLGPLMTTTA